MSKFVAILTFVSWFSLAGAKESDQKELCRIVGVLATLVEELKLDLLDKAKLDAAVEIETSLVDALFDKMAPLNGKLSGFFEKHRFRSLPPEIYEKAKKNSPNDPFNAGWGHFSPKEKRLILDHATATRRYDFFGNRIVEGLGFDAQVVSFQAKADFSFNGKSYKKGEAVHLDLRKILTPQIEYQTPSVVNRVSPLKRLWLNWRRPASLDVVDKTKRRVTGVEMHARKNVPVSELVIAVRMMQQGMKLPVTHLHTHIVGELPYSRMVQEGNLAMLHWLDNFVRTNLVAQLFKVRFDNSIINEKVSSDGSSVNFGYLDPKGIKSAAKYIHAVSRGNFSQDAWFRAHHGLKMFDVGLRGSERFDQPGLYSYEYRSISKNTNVFALAPVLDLIQFNVRNMSFLKSPQYLKTWLEKNQVDELGIGNLYSQTWPLQSSKVLEAQLPPRLKPSFGPEIKDLITNGKKYQEAGESVYKKDQQFKWLVFNWSKVPALANEAVQLERIFVAQGRALQEIQKGGSPNRVVRKFIDESGVLEFFIRTLKEPVNPSDASRLVR